MKISHCKNCGKEFVNPAGDFCSRDCVKVYFESEDESM